MPKLIDLAGQKFGWWIVLKRSTLSDPYHTKWLCRCKCGTKRSVYSLYLRSGGSQSCGCKIKIQGATWNKTHGKAGTRIYDVWVAMKKRCNPNNPHGQKNYSSRGITVCKRWLKFENFFADMGPRPRGKTLERRNNDKGYSPSNCKWATYAEQNANRRPAITERLITFNGETHNARTWAHKLKVHHSLILRRLNRGLSVELAFSLKSWQKP